MILRGETWTQIVWIKFSLYRFIWLNSDKVVQKSNDSRYRLAILVEVLLVTIWSQSINLLGYVQIRFRETIKM